MKFAKRSILPVMVCFLMACTGSKKGQVFYVFNAQIHASDVVGTSSFDDVGVKYHTTVIPDLSDDSTTYLWRLGTVRINSIKYKNGTYPLFNLSSRDADSGFPLLDLIDKTFYLAYGHQIIENKYPTISSNEDYKGLMKILREGTPLEFRKALHYDEKYQKFKDLFLTSRFFINDQLISDTVVKRILSQTNIDLSVSTSIDQIISNAVKTSNSNDKPGDSVKLSALIKKVFNQHTGLHGFYRSASFRPEYVDVINEIVTGKMESDMSQTDLFERNLKFYINSKNNALNTFMAAFKFSGHFGSERATYDSINAALKAQFHFGDSQAASVAAAISHQYVKDINETFSNSFNKLWIIGFGTDQLMDQLIFKGQKPHKTLSSKEREKLPDEVPYYQSGSN